MNATAARFAVVGRCNRANTKTTTHPLDGNCDSVLDLILATTFVKIAPLYAIARDRRHLALLIQAAERRNLNATRKPKSYGEYDGTNVKQYIRDEYPEHKEDTIARIDAMRGQRNTTTRRTMLVSGQKGQRVVVKHERAKVGYAEPTWMKVGSAYVQVHSSYKIQKFDFQKQR